MNTKTEQCLETEDSIAGVLEGLSTSRLTEHVADCDHCRDLKYDAETVAAAVAQAGADFQPSAGFAERMIGLVLEARPDGPAPTSQALSSAPRTSGFVATQVSGSPNRSAEFGSAPTEFAPIASAPWAGIGWLGLAWLTGLFIGSSYSFTLGIITTVANGEAASRAAFVVAQFGVLGAVCLPPLLGFVVDAGGFGAALAFVAFTMCVFTVSAFALGRAVNAKTIGKQETNCGRA